MSKMKEWRFLFDIIRCSLTEDVPGNAGWRGLGSVVPHLQIP